LRYVERVTEIYHYILNGGPNNLVPLLFRRDGFSCFFKEQVGLAPLRWFFLAARGIVGDSGSICSFLIVAYAS